MNSIITRRGSQRWFYDYDCGESVELRIFFDVNRRGGSCKSNWWATALSKMRLKAYFDKLDKPYVELLSNSLWSIIGSVVAKFLLFLVWIFVARVLSPEVYGEFSIIKSTTLLFTDFVGMSFAIAATKYVAEALSDTSKLGELIGFFLLVGAMLGLMAGCLLFFMSDQVCRSLLKADYLSPLLKTSSVVMFVSTLNHGQLGILRGFNKYKIVAKINLLQILISVPFFVLGTIFLGLDGAVYAYIIYNIVVCLIAQHEIRKVCRACHITIAFDHLSSKLTVALNYVLPYMLSTFITMFARWYNETQVAALEGGGFVQLGYYSAINVVQNMITSFAIVVCSPFVPLMAKYKKDSSSISILNRLNILIPLYVSMLIVVPLMLFPEAMNLFYGKDYANREVYQLTVILMSYIVLIIYRQSISRLVAVYELLWIYLIDSIVLSVSCVLGFKMLYSYGVLGLTYSLGISYLLSCLIFTPIYVRKGVIQKELFNNKLLWELLIMMVIAAVIFVLNWNIWTRAFWLILFIGMYIYGIFREVQVNKEILKKE